MTENGLEYSIATSWDDVLLEGLAALNNAAGRQASIAEIYGSHRATITGGGRPSYRLPEVSEETFERHLALAQRLGLRFNYVLNAPTFDGREKDPEWLRQVGRFLDRLGKAGVSSLTIANEMLLRFARREYPGFRIYLSLIAGVDTVEAARRFEDMGVDVIILSPFTANRDFFSLRAIRAAVTCGIELYANIACLSDCRFRDAHYCYSGRGSRIGGNDNLTSDPFLMMCSSMYLTDPMQFLRTPFIRPEDVGVYRDLGINAIKLSDRSETTEFLLKTAKAYLAERYDGNLFDLVFRSGRKFRAGLGDRRADGEDLTLPVEIDNDALSSLDFINRIRDLSEPALSEFYRLAVREAVSLPDSDTLSRWRTILSA